jgi:ABC-2 type transport system ATP-binding protein
VDEVQGAGDRGGGAGGTAADEGEPAAEPGGDAHHPAKEPAGVAVSAEGFGLKGPRGPVFQDVTFDLPAGRLGAVEGPSGSGRTCLLLALTGRMKARTGEARVGRARLPRQMAAVRRVSALGPVPGVTDLDTSLTVAEHLRERVLLEQRFGDSLQALLRPRREQAAERKALLDTALDAAGLDLVSLPKAERTHVRDLERPEALRLSVALAMLSRPRLLAVDDLDLKLSQPEREAAWSMLRGIAEAGTTVLAVSSHAPEDAVVVRTRSGADMPRSSENHHATAAGRNGRTTKEGAPDALAEARRA